MRLNIVNGFLLIVMSLRSQMHAFILPFYNSRRCSPTFKEIEQIENKTKKYSNDFLYGQSISQTKEIIFQIVSFKKNIVVGLELSRRENLKELKKSQEGFNGHCCLVDTCIDNESILIDEKGILVKTDYYPFMRNVLLHLVGNMIVVVTVVMIAWSEKK